MKILLADDHPVIRKGLKLILSGNHAISLIDEAGSGQETLAKVLKNDYDIVILDITMPDMSGINVLSELKSQRPNLTILVLGIHPEEIYAVYVIKAGASGYLDKESAPDELIKAIKKVSTGGLYVSPTVAEKMAFRLHIGDEEPLHGCLSCREFEVMHMVCMGKTPKQICDELTLSPKMISTYRYSILQKMGMKTNTELIRYCIQNQVFD